MILLRILSLIFAQVVSPSISPPTSEQQVEVLPGQKANLSALSLDDLIDQLPDVGAEGHCGAKSDEWRLVPAVEEMKRRLGAGTALTAAQWQRALTRTGIVYFRSKWPVGEPVKVAVRDSNWLPLVHISLKPRDPSLTLLQGGTTLPEMCGVGTDSRTQVQLHQTVGALPLGKHLLLFDASFDRGEVAPGAGVFWRGELAFDVEVVATLAEAFPPKADSALDDAVRDSLGIHIRLGSGRDRRGKVFLVFDADTRAHPELETTAISAKVQLLRDNQVELDVPLTVQRYDFLLWGYSIYDGSAKVFGLAALDALPADALNNKDELARWKLRVEGTDAGILMLWHARTTWSGSFDAPLADLLARERARTEGKSPRALP